MKRQQSSEHRSISSTSWRVMDELHQAEVDMLNQLLGLLPEADDEIIDEWLEKLERHTQHHFTEEEAEMERIAYPQYDSHRYAHAETLRHLREARRMWEQERDLMRLWNFLEKDYFDWFEKHVRQFDMPVAEHIRRFSQR